MASPYRTLSRELLSALYVEARENQPWPPPIETVDVKVSKVIAETDKAMLAVIDGREYWVPFSCIMEEPESAARSWNREVEITLWWVKQANLPGYI